MISKHVRGRHAPSLEARRPRAVVGVAPPAGRQAGVGLDWGSRRW
eukprot:CAMPEP_0172010470 /NCGR_PEP_ID=MMETSP1041-20130122/7758_1 /TAXON_ID=464988 /ORGANISM="Hemiselmis andersenii, Strain CCMP439" /LENGTH=44 /DNA_ID= /DNA_START= /DNA_END= /DNA_ORIENTATION=